jgi:large subunit ribosomal protein L4
MPEVALYDKHGEKLGQAQLSDDLFAAPINHDLLHQAVVAVEESIRHYAARTARRSEVSLTKGKWYRQKGTGRARHGARSAPIFVGGGVAHGPRGPRRKARLPRRMRRQALASAFSAKVHEGAVIVVDEMSVDEISTRQFRQMLEQLSARGRTLVLLGSEEARDEKLYKSSRNLPELIVRESPHLNARDVIWAETIIISQAGLEPLDEGARLNA